MRAENAAIRAGASETIYIIEQRVEHGRADARLSSEALIEELYGKIKQHEAADEKARRVHNLILHIGERRSHRVFRVECRKKN